MSANELSKATTTTTTTKGPPVLQFRVDGSKLTPQVLPTKESNTKILLKPPKYGYAANIAPKTPNIESILTIKKLANPNPGETAGLKVQTSTKGEKEKTYDKNKENQPLDSSAETTTSSISETADKESKSIVDLRKRLKYLREQLLENRNEIGSFDFGQNDEEDEEEDDEDVNEVEIINESDEEEDEKQSSLKSALVEEQKKVDDKVKLSDSTLSLAKHLNHLSIESLDLKTKKLIEKSESTLSKLVSSDGLSSSSQSTATSSTVSSDFQPPEPVYKPEFVKFLDNQLKPSAPLKPEEDILYQWRLRRKIEEAQKEADNKNLTIQIPSSHSLPNQTTTNVSQQQQLIKPASVTPVSQPSPSPSSISVVTKRTAPLISTETQTVEKADLATQTSIETVVSSSSSSKPTKSNEEKKQISTSKKPSGFRSSSPKKKQTESPVVNNTTNDLTKVSDLISPLSAVPSHCLPHQKQPTTSTSFASSISSMTNITSRMTSPRDSRDDHIDEPQKKIDHQHRDKIEQQKNDIDDDDVFESDEILQILFKKKYFYEMKLKQIDELLLKSNI